MSKSPDWVGSLLGLFACFALMAAWIFALTVIGPDHETIDRHFERDLSALASLALSAKEQQVTVRVGEPPIVGFGANSFTAIDEAELNQEELDRLLAEARLAPGSGTCAMVLTGPLNPERLRVCAPDELEGELRITLVGRSVRGDH